MRALVERLRSALERPLPGAAGQLRMAPRPRPGWRPSEWPDDCRHGGGLLLLYPVGGEPHVLLTLRESTLPVHAGQVSLPGGATEPGESSLAAALREAREEVGLDPQRIDVLGPLSPLHVPVSRFVIHPWLAAAAERPALEPDPREVARLVEVPLGDLCDAERQRIERRVRARGAEEIPYFAVDGERVWGATAMIVAEFLCLLGQPPEPRLAP